MKNKDKVVHVQFNNGKHFYFGSIAAIFDLFDPDTIGVKPTSLYCYNLSKMEYKNKICTIRRGNVIRKPNSKG